ncbi:Ger(x)C family spore germination protein [Clostridium sp.]|uniref:Ger(x)C family spore germination protein n=1 Tax=Clostridium sp. TaxID=1506 RepID=UPI003463A720
MKGKKLIILPLLLCLIFTGCWDKVEIDRKIFISTIAVDVGEDIDKDKELKEMSTEEIPAERSVKKLKVIYSYPDLSKFSPEKGTIEEEGVLEMDTYSMDGAMADAAVKSSRDISLDHTRLLILSRDLLRYEDTFKEVLDYLKRQPKLNRRLYVIMSAGPPNEFTKAKLPSGSHLQVHINGIMENAKRNSAIQPVTLNDLLINLSADGSGTIPIMKMDKDTKEIAISGTAIIKDHKLKGNINEIESVDFQILKAKAKGGNKVVYYEGHPVDYEIDGILKKTRVEYDEKLKVNINLEIEGRIQNAYLEGKKLDEDMLKKLANDFNTSISSQCEKVAELIQKEMEVDVIGISTYIEKFKPSMWKKIKDDWDEIFKEAEINVNVKSHIRRMGVTD